MNGSLSHTMCSLVMTSSLAVVTDSLSLTGAWFEGLERGDPNEFDCRAPAIFSRVCQIPGPSRSVCCSALHNLAWTRGRRVGEGSPRGLRDRGAGGKGRATDLRTGRGSVALGVLPLVSSLPVPAVPCHSLPYPCPIAWALPHLPLQFCPVSRDFPQSACSNSTSTSSGRRRSSWEGGWYWDAMQLPLCPLPGVVTLHLGRGGDENGDFVCADRPAIFQTYFYCSIIAYLHM